MGKPFTMGEKTRLLIAHLKQKPKGIVVPYNELDDIIGVVPGSEESVRDKSRTNLRTACEKLEEDRIYFATVYNEGIQRISANKAMENFNNDRKARNQAKRGQKKLRHIDYSALTEEQKVQWNVKSSICAATQLVTSEREQKKIEGVVKETGQKVIPKIDSEYLKAYKGI